VKIYGLLGKDIGYSLSPLMHNAAFKALGLDAEYRIFDIPENELDSFFSNLKKGTPSGCNVTIPYKEKALEFVDKCDGPAEDIGAINTVTVKEGKLSGYNTDYQGFVEALSGREDGDLNFAPKGKDAFIFGAGGAAKAVIYGLMGLGAKRIAITDINITKSENLASSIVDRKTPGSLITAVKDKAKYEEFVSKSDLLVNATPCGIKNGSRLFDYRYIHEKLYVFDLIYAADTPLVKEARSRGAKAINGLNMLLYQAAASFKIWTGIDVPLEIMRKVVMDKQK
jgi:shikimate dehydrogenase